MKKIIPALDNVTMPSGLGDYHGSAADRGSADAYYRREYDPHYYPNGTYNGEPVKYGAMTREEIDAYHDAFYSQTDFKDWG